MFWKRWLMAVAILAALQTGEAVEPVEVMTNSGSGTVAPTVPGDGKQIKRVDSCVALAQGVSLFDTAPLLIGAVAGDIDITEIKIEVMTNTGVTAGNEAVIGFGLVTPGAGQLAHAEWIPYQNCLGLVASGTTFSFPIHSAVRTVRNLQEIWMVVKTAPAAGSAQVAKVMAYGVATGLTSASVVSPGGSDVNGVTDTMYPIGVNATGQPVRGSTSYATAAGGVTGLTNPRIPFAATATTLDDDAAHSWDDTHKGISLGKNASAGDTSITGGGSTFFGDIKIKTSAEANRLNLIFDRYGSPPDISFNYSNGTSAAPTAVVANDLMVYLHSNGWDTASQWAGASIKIRANAGKTGSIIPSSIELDLPDSTSGGIKFQVAGTTKSYINSDGNYVQTTGAGAGKVLTSDAGGIATWGAAGGGATMATVSAASTTAAKSTYTLNGTDPLRVIDSTGLIPLMDITNTATALQGPVIAARTHATDPPFVVIQGGAGKMLALGHALLSPDITWFNNRGDLIPPGESVNTTDATVTTLETITLAASHTTHIYATVMARRTGGAAGAAEDGATYTLDGAFKMVTGTATQIGTTTKVEHEDQAGWDCIYSLTGATVRIRGTGAVDNNVTWQTRSVVYQEAY